MFLFLKTTLDVALAIHLMINYKCTVKKRLSTLPQYNDIFRNFPTISLYREFGYMLFLNNNQ